MQEFSYKALDSRGKRLQASLMAPDEQDALRQLQQRGLTVVRLESRSSRSIPSRPAASVTSAQLATLLRDLAMLVEAGVPLAEAVASQAGAQPPGHPMHQVLASLRGGGMFSDAFANSGMRAPVFVVQLLKAGEATGQLAHALQTAAEHLEHELRFATEARNALLYPAVLVGSGFLATLVMFVFVVPKFAGILSNPKADVPLVSQWVLGFGLWLTHHEVIVGMVFATSIALGVAAAGQPQAREYLWELGARLPVLGRWSWHAEIARWASLLSVLLNSKVPLLVALSQANQSLRRQALRQAAGLVLSDVRGGKPLSQALTDHALLDAAGVNLIRVGERAGTLAITVASLAKSHVAQSEQRLKRFLVLLEPITILMISAILGGIMISVMLAITSLTNVL